MSGQDKIADQIRLEPLSMDGRGLPPHSYFEVTFADGSKRPEHNTNWSDISEPMVVEYFGKKKQIMACKFPVKQIKVFHDGMEAVMEVPEGCSVYQAIRARAEFIPGRERVDSISGRCVGVVKDGVVIEERFINQRQHEVMGMRL